MPGGVRGHTYPGFTDSRRQLGQPRVPLVCRHLQKKAGGWQGVPPPPVSVLPRSTGHTGGHAAGPATHEICHTAVWWKRCSAFLHKRKPRCSPFLLGTAAPLDSGGSPVVV